MAIIDPRVRTIIDSKEYSYLGLTSAGEGDGNFFLLDAATNFGNITVALTTTAGVGWAGAEDSANDNKEVNYDASTYTVNGQTPTFENVIIE